jgi:hypothetical protein
MHRIGFAHNVRPHHFDFLLKGGFMKDSTRKELYNSPNGDRWFLLKDNNGKLVVIHEPNKSSGGTPSEVAVDVFLAHSGRGPEHEALVQELAALGPANSHQQLSAEETERLSRALGQAVAQCWSNLPQPIQHALFEATVSSEGEIIRQDLAAYLHEKHARTREVLQAKAMPTPDSLGG